MIFGRRKNKNETSDQPETAAESAEEQTPGEAPDPAADPEQAEAAQTLPKAAKTDAELRSSGPFDSAEKDTDEGYLDLGALKIQPRDGLQLRLEVEEKTQRVIAVTLDLSGSSLQLQAFAAPKSEGLWEEIREQLASSIGSQGGTVEEVSGPLGTEVVAKLPAQTPDGKRGFRVARFIGVDGPRWFLRGVIGGAAALDRAKAAELEELFRQTVVVRGDQPLPPRDLLTLRLPKDASLRTQDGQTPPGQPAPGLSEPERGPEITHIG